MLNCSLKVWYLSLHHKPKILTQSFLSVQVAELKLELKLRGLPVSGTKTDLMERLKPFQDNTTAAAPAPPTFSAVPMEVAASTSSTALVVPVQQLASESTSSTPPVSPIPTDSSITQKDMGPSEAPLEALMLRSGLAGPLSSFRVPEEKDRRLHEKERQIEELMRKLEHEQRLVEELKMQLEVEKRGQGGCVADSASLSPKLTSVPSVNPGPAVLNSNVVKMEGTVLSNCSSTALPNSILSSHTFTSSLPTVVKLEDVNVSSGKPLQLQTQTQLLTQMQPQSQPQATTSPQLIPQSQRSPKLQPQSRPAAPSLQQFFISHSGGVSQVLGQPQTLLTTSRQPQTLLTTTGQAGTQILLPVSLPNSAAAIQLPSSTVSLQVNLYWSRPASSVVGFSDDEDVSVAFSSCYYSLWSQPVLQAAVSNPGLVQASVSQLQSAKMETASSQQLANNNPLLQVSPVAYRGAVW